VTVQAVEAAPVDQAAIDRADAQARALEAAIAAAAVAVITSRVAAIARDLTVAFARWGSSSPGRWAAARRDAAARLRSVPVRVSETVAPQLWRAARLGARQAGVPLPDGYDPAVRERVRESLDRVDDTVRDRLRDVARAVADAQVTTPAQLEEVTGRVEAVASTARARVEDVVARTVADGAHAAVYGQEPPEDSRPVGDEEEAPVAADGDEEPPAPDEPAEPAGPAAPALDLTWWSERDACLACASLAGALPGQDGLYRQVLAVTRASPRLTDEGCIPPLHPHCRCRLVPATPGLADALRREAQREVAYGWSAYDSLGSRLRAADLLVGLDGLLVPKTVVRRARGSVRQGRFSEPQPPPRRR
jgi:hypothetical protein